MIRSALLSGFAAVGHAHSTREDGPVGPPDLLAAVAGREALVRAAGGDPARLVVPTQVHRANVAVVDDADAATRLHGIDALVTASVGVPLLTQGADCPLVAFVDPRAGVVAAVHSGWRGTVACIVDGAVRAAGTRDARAERIRAAVFPGIGPCCFEVGPEVRSAFLDTFGEAASPWFTPSRRPDHSLLDLAAAIVRTLLSAGVERSCIDVVAGCTACDGRFYSHRISHGAPERHGLCVVRLA